MKDFEIRCDESHLETNNTLYGKFTLGPFLPGQGTTFGNALRRTLLSELSGLAITAFEILGVMQEFSTLPGLRESVLDLSLNLKQVVLTGVLPYSTPPVGFLKIKGPAIIKAMDLKLPVGVYCAHPEQYIATIASNGALNLKFVVSVGKGYSVQPYSLYRSLSKIRLQPAFSPYLEKSENHNDYLPFFEQQNIEGGSSEGKPSTRSLFNNTKEMENKIFSNTNLSGENLETSNVKVAATALHTTSFASSMHHKAQQEKGDAWPSAKQGIEKTLNPLGKTDVQHSGRFAQIAQIADTVPLHAPATSIGQRSIKTKQAKTSPYEASKAKNLSPVPPFSSVSESRQTKEAFTASFGPEGVLRKKMHKQSNEKRLPSTHSEMTKVNASLKSVNNTTLLTGVGEHRGCIAFGTASVDIQTQVFQRVNSHQVLPIDAVFAPVSRVNFLTQVNDRFETIRENIVLEIWTNGSIHPKRALEEATLFLVQNFDTLLKKIQQASSFYKGLRYWNYLQSFDNININTTTENVSGPSPLYQVSPSTHTTFGDKVIRHSPDSFASSMHPKAQQTKNAIDLQIQGKKKKIQKEIMPPSETNTKRFASENSNEYVLFDHFADTSSKKKEFLKQYLHQAVSNLDIGNLNLSLQTFITLKKAKIQTLSQLLTTFSLDHNNKLIINPKGFLISSEKIGFQSGQTEHRKVERSLFLNEKTANELKTVICHFTMNQ